jgi:hypothetical protein
LNEWKQNAAISLSKGHFRWDIAQSLKVDDKRKINYPDRVNNPPIAEFCYNNTPSSTTGVLPFFANKGYNPAFTVHSGHELASLKAQELVTDLRELHSKLWINIQESQECYQQSADKNRIPPLEFKVGDKAFGKAKFFHQRSSPKNIWDLLISSIK